MIQRNLVHLLNVAIREYRSPQASSPIWATEASLARTRERGASPLARAFSQDLFHSPKQESLLAGYEYRGNFPKLCDFAVLQ